MQMLKGHPAEDLARLCFSKLRFLSPSLKAALRREGLWEDLAQELYRVALEGWIQGRSAREMGGMAGREIRAFLRAYGFGRRQGRDGDLVSRAELPLSTIGDGQEYLRERILAGAEPVPNGHTRVAGLEEAILALLTEHPQGLTQAQVNRALRQDGYRALPAATIVAHCDRLVTRGAVREVAMPQGRGRPPGALLIAETACEQEVGIV